MARKQIQLVLSVRLDKANYSRTRGSTSLESETGQGKLPLEGY